MEYKSQKKKKLLNRTLHGKKKIIKSHFAWKIKKKPKKKGGIVFSSLTPHWKEKEENTIPLLNSTVIKS